MKKILFILSALLTYTLAAEDAKTADPIDPFRPQVEKPGTGPDSLVSRIDLDTHHNVNDAIQQIIAGLSPEGRRFLVLDISEEELAKMPVKRELRLRNVPLSVALKYLGQHSPVGYRLWNNAWHISNARPDDIIVIDYRLSKERLERLGIVIGPSQTFRTKMGRMWPPESEWSATYTTLAPDTQGKQDAGEPGVLRLRAARSYQEEFGAALLLKERGYEALSLER